MDGPAAFAVDGLMANRWGAGAGPPQWIEIDLAAPVTIGRILLFVTQTPNGWTAHRIYGRAATGDPWQQLHEFNGFTNDNAVLEHVPASPWTNMRYVRVSTAASVSWVSWREIQVFAP